MQTGRCRSRISRIYPHGAAYTDGPYQTAFWLQLRNENRCRHLPKSVHLEAWNDAQAHKWNQSGEHHCDRGRSAIDEWYTRHHLWFCRHLLLEHVTGIQHWQEFGEESFGALEELLVEGCEITGRILDKVLRGAEALDLSFWKHDSPLTAVERERVDVVLALIDINRARLDRVRMD